MKNRYLPFGYKIADGKIMADSEQVEAVRRIFDAYTACLLYTSPSPRDRG